VLKKDDPAVAMMVTAGRVLERCDGRKMGDLRPKERGFLSSFERTSPVISTNEVRRNLKKVMRRLSVSIARGRAFKNNGEKEGHAGKGINPVYAREP